MKPRPAIFAAALAPLLAWAGNPEILVNPQGLAQQDLSIRGSSYAGTGLSINGVMLDIPWSRHFNAELPLPQSILSEAEARRGLHNISGHLVGTADHTIQPFASRSEAQLGLGSKERYQASLFGSSENLGGFIDGEKAKDIDYGANDLDRLSGSAFVQFMQNGWQFDILSASQSKRYGAQGYYGIPATTYAEERTEDQLIYLGACRGDLDGAYLRAGTGLRAFNDEYSIPSSLFYQEVLSRSASLMVEGRTLEVQHILLNVRGDLLHERIDRDVDLPSRTRGSLVLLPEARFGHFAAKGGLNTVFQTSESAEWMPQAGIDWFTTDNATLYASYSENVQQPDYQSLASNAALQLQRAKNSEVGFRQLLSASLDWRIAAFHRRQENASDWQAGTAIGLGTLNVDGCDAAIHFAPSDKLDVQGYYQWIHKDGAVAGGLYESDYPEHLVAVSGFWRFAPAFRLFGAQTLRWQADHLGRTGGDFGADASLGLQYSPRYAKNVRLSLLAENLWNSDFQAIPGLKPRPASVLSAIAVAW